MQGLSRTDARAVEQALIEMKYDIFITSKKRIEVNNPEKYSVKKVEYPSISPKCYKRLTQRDFRN